MSIYKELTPIINYLTQIRKLENYLVFDVTFPITWKMLKRHIIEDKFVNNGTENNLLNLINTVKIVFIKSIIYGDFQYSREKSNHRTSQEKRSCM